MKIRPLGDRVLVRRDPEERKTAGGIVIPENAGEKPSKGTILATGPGKREDGKIFELTVKVNDKIYFGKYAGTEVKVNGEDLLVMREDDIIGVIEG